jgi:glutamate/tyrosine decarboxylase-like PLP-dependent enzyme
MTDDDLLDRAQKLAREYFADRAQRPVGVALSRDELVDRLGGPLPDTGVEASRVLDELAAHGRVGTIASTSPRYFGFVIGGSHPVALAADWLVSTWDQNPGLYATSPLVSVAEETAGAWLLDVLDLPRDASVGFVTGCQMAHTTCLAAARHAVLRDAGHDVEADGLADAPRVNLVASAEAHVTVDVALRYLGFGTRAIRRVDADAQGRMRADALAALLPTLSGPTIVCAQAGNVNTGAFDPLPAIADACAARGAWLHVDGAFGLWARAGGDVRPLADGVERADSWATDAHKWLNVPYDCGVAIVRDGDAHRHAMTSQAAYLIQGAGYDAVDWTPEFSRRARGVPVYATLRALGRDGVRALVERCCAHARRFADGLRAAPGVTVLNDVVLNQVLVRFGDDDATTRAVVAGVQAEGTCWLSGTTWHGLAAMRISVSNWATGEEDVDRSVAAILRVFAGPRAA